MSDVAEQAPAGEPRAKLFIIDDEEALCRALARAFSRKGFDVTTQSDPLEAVITAQRAPPDVVLLDLRLPHVSGVDVLKELKTRLPDVPVIMMTGNGDVPTALASLRAGAWDYLAKPFDDLDAIAHVVRKAWEHKRVLDRNRELEHMVHSSTDLGLVGDSQRMREIATMIRRVGPTRSTVLIQGESGTGKELVARAVHKASERATKPFVAINCAAMTDTLLESELFGHVKGSFTGAQGNKQGLFEAASGGTLFLDEIGDMVTSTQAALLRALQQGEIRPVGSTQTIKVDVRVIAATNVDLKKAIAAGRFREDLFYRLNVISINVPSLRERAADIPMLAYHFLRQAAAKMGKRVERISSRALTALVSARWAGNVRELENVLERAVILSSNDEVTIDELPPELRREGGAGESDMLTLSNLSYAQAKQLAVGAFNKSYLKGVLNKTQGNVSAAAVLAGLDRSNFRRLLKRHALAGSAIREAGDELGDDDMMDDMDDDDGVGSHKEVNA
jgi:two-component system response regulator HydG